MNRLLRLAGVVAFVTALAVTSVDVFAQTDTPVPPTATPTSTNTPVIVSTPTGLAALTPRPSNITNTLQPSTKADGEIVMDGGDLVILPSSDGGNRGSLNQVVGSVREDFAALGTMTNGSTESTLYTDDTPAGEWTAVDTDAVVSSATDNFKVGSAALKLAFGGGATDGDGATNDITNDNLEADEHIGGWAYASETVSGGDLRLVVDDTSDDTYYLLPSIPKKRWTWIDLDITDLASGRADVVDKISVQLTTQGASAHGAFDFYLDALTKWDAADEEALGYDVFDGGCRVAAIPTTPGTSNTPTVLALYTDYFIGYRTGNDVLITLTDQSAKSGLALCQHY